MVTTQQIVSMVANICKMWGFSYLAIDNGNVNCENLPDCLKPSFRYNHQVSIMFQNQKLGHQDLYVYSSVENGVDKVVAVLVSNATKTLLQSCAKYGHKFYGFPYRAIEKAPIEMGAESYYFIF